MRLFPIVFGTSAVICINILSYYRNGFPILSSLGSLALTMSLFLVLITLIDRLNRSDFKIVDTRQNNLSQNDLLQNDLPQGSLPQDGLFEIKKENVSESRKAGASLEERIYQSVYIISFLGIAFWRIIGIFKAAPLSYVGQYRAGIVDALLLFILPCVCVLYLKMRKDGLYPSDKITQDILSFFSYTSFFYAAVIATAAVLKINILGILPPLFYAASAYLSVSLAVNIAISMLKGNILSFDYTLFPKITRIKDKTNLYAETQEAKWNVSIKSLYTIKYTITILPALLLVLIFILFLSTTIFTVQPHQQAAVYRFGKLDRSSIKNEGAHFKFPWPIEKTEIYDVHRVSSMQIGYESSGTANFLWTKTHDGGEYMLLLGNGNEMAAVNLKIMYVISDLYLYIKSCTNPEAVLNAAAYNALMSRTVNTTLDSFLNVDRNSLSVSVLEELSQVCTAENMGFSVVQVIIESIHPPVEIADVYQKVVSASVDKTTLITRAQAYAEAKIIEAHRQSKTAVEQARAMQYSKISDAQKEAAVFYAATEAYRISGGSFELTRYLDVYEKIISGNKVYVFSPGTEKNISKFIIGKVNTVNFLNVNNGGGNE
jgi:regulator of protease activity HflC (stomatin/prohibitin superfamily)